MSTEVLLENKHANFLQARGVEIDCVCFFRMQKKMYKKPTKPGAMRDYETGLVFSITVTPAVH